MFKPEDAHCPATALQSASVAQPFSQDSMSAHLLCRVITISLNDFDGPHEIVLCQVLVGKDGCHLLHAGSVHGPVVAAGLTLAAVAGGTII